MKRRRPSHATAVAYLALFVALGGTAFAAMQVGTKQVKNNSLLSADLRNRKAVGGKDVIPNSLGGREIDEGSLNARDGLAVLSGSQSTGECQLPQSSEVTCASVRVNLKRRSRVLAIASGGEYGTTAPSAGSCKLEFDGNPNTFGSFANPGDAVSPNSAPFATNGFGATGVTSGAVHSGEHKVALVCSGTAGTVIHEATIAALAIGEG